MPILKIARMGHPILRRIAEPVADPTDQAVRRLAEAMIETMIDADGAGLAAPQVHMPWRMVVVQVPAERLAREGETDEAGVPPTVMINPLIEPLGPEKETAFEACLSVPGLAGPVPRFRRIHYRYQTLCGATVERVVEGFHARVIQHECDHLDGILYPMRVEDFSQFGFVEELRRAGSAQGDEDGEDDED
ncbi:MAG: peptide deformylase [Alphaproteobacteria bacterium]|nr:peptide deformylase [Alphaproteobacteria bacterium]